MDNYWEIFLELALGVTLSAAAGFRVFLPPLILSLASVFGHIQLSPDFQWVASPEAVILLAIATVAEIIAFYIPFVDNLLDTVQIPLALVIGTLLTANSLGDLDPIAQWTIAIIAGGGASTAVAGLNGIARLAFTGLTGGLANFLLATAQAVSASALALIAVLVPILTPIVLLLLISIGVYLFLNFPKLKQMLFRQNEQSSKEAN
ncbi:DUF4126 domain-containing protein [Gloeocapsa sp. PCC 73106]|uniref:DUF4126 domain-containing protein n=1 Tax=Gloeocapsa sp. PCC 73106 TaxID=102232 RepID=UPI0002ABA8C2|nr:DUF4126 domain-containing protein [Gloeocapsa sp. PCC 73106]ELR96394.1 hypothetical protein GLO73106DRAFT_00001860 [Gloeocapsa sp. PCC 73106]